MNDDSLPAGVPVCPPFQFRFHWRMTAPDTFYFPDDGQEVGPDTVLSVKKRRLVGRPYRLAKMYLMCRLLIHRGRLVCERCGRVEFSVHPESGLVVADVHHTKDPSTHIPKFLRLLCDTCNGMEGNPASTPKSESESVQAGETKSSSTEFDISYNAMRPRWCKWLISGKWKGGPGPLFDSEQGRFLQVKLDDLCANAPRALARDKIGEEWLGVSKTYRYNYVPQDLDSAGGPLHTFTKINPETNHSETWVRLSDAAKERFQTSPTSAPPSPPLRQRTA